ncbi:hypothetical protein DRJ17_05245 [Candidatus Woesearchaeota archaeon]|nr:MAG: hypothetical protein DRJ17_05245 [Candidatus Woesearchaeota archaeon]
MVADLTLGKILSLAAVDAVNPCALAVLTLVLIAILIRYPKNRIKVLYIGLMFSLSVYILYLIYGLFLVKIFASIQAFEVIRLYLYYALAVIAIVLGTLNIRDAIKYKPGGIATEMPMRFRPRVKKIISGITSPRGAFILGALITLFLLPCTIGPYLIATGILSYSDFLKTVPWLLIYNVVFVSPMIAITLIVYAGFTTVERVSSWKKTNIRWLHFFAGLILLGLGIGMATGVI